MERKCSIYWNCLHSRPLSLTKFQHWDIISHVVNKGVMFVNEEPNMFSRPNLLTKEDLNTISVSKRDFIEKGISPLGRPGIRDEVAQSWMRCRSYGLATDQLPRYPIEKKNNVQDNSELIETTKSLFMAFTDLATLSKYGLYLIDNNYQMLYYVGEAFSLTPSVLAEDEVITGGEEEDFGTSAHALALICRRPVQIVGPEHYLDFLSNNISSAAPIIDQSGTMLGVVSLVLRSPQNLYGDDIHMLQANALGWIASMAMAISQQIESRRANLQLRQSYQTLETSWSLIDEGVLYVDKKGVILNANQQLSHILRKSIDELRGKYFTSFMPANSTLMDKIQAGFLSDYVEDVMIIQGEEQSYLFSARPVYEQDSNIFLGAVIRISNLKKLHRHVASQSSSVVRFRFDDILGDSDSVKSAKNLASIFANSAENILLIGESGTGKEMFAQSIHNQYRPRGPFVALNCAALPRNLVESELFGYEGGSFTGAERKGKMGKIELADGGTLFLDEIGDMPSDIQAVFLRVLEDKTVMRIGGYHYKPINFRLIAATNRDLLSLVETKQFRADLYYRLSSLTVNIPPLRKRSHDILILADHFITEYCKKDRKPDMHLSPKAREALVVYPWPGNIRELEKAIAYAVITCNSNEIAVNDFPESITKTFISTEKSAGSSVGSISSAKLLTLQDMERQQIKEALEQTGNNVVKAAALLGISKSSLYLKLKMDRQ